MWMGWAFGRDTGVTPRRSARARTRPRLASRASPGPHMRLQTVLFTSVISGGGSMMAGPALPDATHRCGLLPLALVHASAGLLSYFAEGLYYPRFPGAVLSQLARCTGMDYHRSPVLRHV
jgi:hypothetical protein